ncbi:MAG: nucleotidyltransferase domain-containing protein [Coriobacteriales bacterium]|jgi:predicted nucleotidyltransferase|nr:nucleotidyltransferase domain-containing protein [Coriobacteriales bacterium]
MNGQTYTIDELAGLVTPIAEEYGVERVFLFGSYARGSQNADSDIDFRI